VTRPERRRRGDIAAAALLVVALAAGASLLWRGSDAAGTISLLADPALTAPPPAEAVPAAFAEAWRAPSGASAAPVVAGPAVVTGDGGAVVGRDALTGAERWRYARDVPLCTVGAGFREQDDGRGRVLAVHAGGEEYCSEMTALRSATGARDAQRNSDVGPGTRLLDGGSLLALTGADYLEVVRSDLVKTLEYGAVPAPEQAGRQPRTGCTFTSFTFAPGRLGVVERCPEEPTDRLTVLTPDGSEGADTPEEQFSVALPTAGAVLVALSDERAAVALPGPPRLQLLDGAGLPVGMLPLDVPAADLAAPPPGGVAAVATDADRVYWWTGSRTVALDGADLAPLWTVDGTLGPALPYAARLLVPVPDGLLEIDPVSGTVTRTLPLSRAEPAAPVRLAAAGAVLLEQRGSELVALRPAP
jgi:hypothetical protein